jgi:hypothetical protein
MPNCASLRVPTGSSMSNAKFYREKACFFNDAANTAADQHVRLTLLRLARSALQTATEMEDTQARPRSPARAESDKEN